MMKRYWYVVIGVLIYFVFANRLGTLNWDTGHTMGFGIIMLGVFIGTVWDSFRANSPQIIWNGGHATTDGEIDLGIGNFAVMRPSLKAFGIYWKLTGLIAFPQDGYETNGMNINVNVKMETVELDELPRDVRSYAYEKKIKPPYRIGYADSSQYLEPVYTGDGEKKVKHPEVGYLVEENKLVNKENSLLRKQMSSLMQDVESKTTWKERLKDPFGFLKTGFEDKK